MQGQSNMPPTQAAAPTSRDVFWAGHLRRKYQLLLDFGWLATALVVAYLLRFDFNLPEPHRMGLLVQLPVVVLAQFLSLLLLGVYSFVWRYVGMAEVQTFVRATLYGTAPILLLRFGLSDRFQEWKTPLSIILIDAVLGFGGLVAMRVLRRWIYERYERSRREEGAKGRVRRPVILAGAGRAGVLAAREILGRGDLDITPVAFVDDDPQKRGATIHGIRVMGTTEDLPALARRLEADHVIITMASVNARTIRRIVDTCETAGVRVRIIPGLYEILGGSVAITRIRDVQIEDLLGREPVALDEASMASLLAGKCVLVTGAGGSIGTELARQVLRFGPRELVLVERSEGALFSIDREIREIDAGPPVLAVLTDAGDGAEMRDLLRRRGVDIVLHAAAHKHVPLMESHPAEAVRNNVLGTEALARACGEAGVEAFVMLSTDKAVRPSSIMGASKRVAELILQGLDTEFPATRFVAVRFGNVMGSAGSVVPIFREQIARGGPVTVTDPDATRYFMTIPEAAQLVLQAGALAQGGEIMVLDMGKPIRIGDLARDMISLSGLRPDLDIEIVETGLRPGEKLAEQLLLDEESADPTRHPKILIGHIARLPEETLRGALQHLAELAERDDGDGIRRYLNELLPEATIEVDELPAVAVDGRGEQLVNEPGPV